MALESTSTIGVMDDVGIVTYTYGKQIYGRFPTGAIFSVGSLVDLLTMAHALEIDTLWIAPGSDVSRRAKEIVERRQGVTLYGKSTIDRDGTPRFILLTGKPSVKIAWPEWDDRWPWAKCSDASTLLKSLLSLQDALEVKVEWSPGHTGQELMEQCTGKHPAWLAPVELPADVKAHTAVDMKWKRALTKDEQRPGMWFHAFDKNSAYLAACTGVNLGEGEPLHLTGKVIFKARVPGLWKWGDTWKWTPELEYMLASADNRLAIVFDEAYVWPHYHQALRIWGEHMWDARQALEKNSLEYLAVKKIYTQSLGWLTFDRPDHWSMIVAGAYRSTAFKKRQMEHQAGLLACFWNADMLGFISWGETLEPYQRHMLNRLGMLGGFKHVGSVPVDDLAASFEDDVSWEECHDAVLRALEGVKV